MQILRWALTCLATVGLIQSSFAAPSSGLGHKDPMPEIFVKPIKDLTDGVKGETLAELYARMAPLLTDDANFQLAPFLKDKGAMPAPDIKSDGNEVTFSRGKYKVVLKYERDDKGFTVMHANGQLITEEDHKSMSNLFGKLEKIIRESGQKHAGLFQSLFLPQAQADDVDWMWVLGGAGVGAAVGYGLSSFLGVGGIAGALIGGAIGAAAAYFFAPRKCSSTQQCCLVGTVYQIGCCSQISGTEVTPPFGGTCPVQTVPYVAPLQPIAPPPAAMPVVR